MLRVLYLVESRNLLSFMIYAKSVVFSRKQKFIVLSWYMLRVLYLVESRNLLSFMIYAKNVVFSRKQKFIVLYDIC